MTKGKAENEFINLSDSQIYRDRRRDETSINSMLQSIESRIDLGASFRNEFWVEGLLVMAAAIGIGMVAVLIRAGWLQ